MIHFGYCDVTNCVECKHSIKFHSMEAPLFDSSRTFGSLTSICVC